MSRDKKNNQKKKTNITSISQGSDGDYDLERSLRRVQNHSKGSRNKSKNRAGITETLEENDNQGNNGAIQETVDKSPQTYSGGISWDSYLRLDEKISSFDEKNSIAHTELRKELEQKMKNIESSCSSRMDSLDNKLEKRISRSSFYWVIGGLLAILAVIVTIWWHLSYLKVHETPDKIQNIENRIQVIENNFNKEADKK